MDGVINISSDSDGDESDVEILGTHRNILIKDDPLPLSTVRIDVNALRVNVPTHINLTEPRWTHSGLIIGKSENSTSLTVIDLTESDIANVTEHETEKLPQEDCPIKKDCTDEIQIINKQDFSTRKRSSGDPPIFTLKQDDCSNLKPKQSSLDSQTQHQKRTNEVHHHTPTLRQLPFIETHVTELKTPKCSNHLSKDSTQISVQPRLLDSNSEEPECISNFKTTTTSNGPHMGPLLEVSPPKVIESLVRQEQQVNCDFTSSQINGKISLHQLSPANFACSGKEGSVATSKEHITREDERGDVCLSIPICSPTSCSVSQDKAQASFQREDVCSNPEQLKLNQAESGQIYLSEQPSTHSPTTGLNPSKAFEIDSLSHTSHMSYNLMRQSDPTSASEPTLVEKTSERQLEEFKADEASNSPDLFHGSIHSESLFSFSKAEDMDNGSRPGTFRGDLGNDSPLSILWQEWSDGDQANGESRFDMTFRVASSEDRHFVCPVTLRKIMSGPAQTLVCEEDKGFGMPEMLCRQSLSLVYSTIDEHYTEGTLQLLSDLLQPGCYPPKDITYHLLHDILLNPQCPYHLCVQAFNLLIRTQRHHMADITTVPWDWELLSLVIDNQEQIQDHTKRQRCEVVCMLFEYVVLTLEDDFQAKLSTSALHHSIAKATLSCDQQFPRVRDVIKWLFSAIKKSTEQEESKAERDEPIRMVSFLQRMLSLALEVDRSPALNSAQMSQELFLMLIGKMHLRAHRMLLLESLQSKLVRCKLLEQLLDYACPVKTHLPMSLSLLLHFMKNCTLAPDPADGTERWQRWEELVHLLWMLLLSYNKAMKGCLYSSVTEQRRRVGTLVYKQADMITKPAVCEAVEAFLSRSQADLGEALPLHVEESLTYLQDHLLDVCQC